ncbi:3-carboxy-cis,cis-muconate cycloisomerase [Actinomadura coerulea]|uniref:3-carboxy-cis,cis-muconate cycloisomerase n=1 Tax=Actinomadura coerulea TaxID=46159 RepID=A0A7X0FXN6_9ACTN|nr:3-carboxy-cis,cis-muconate cycloisomerase [Actinomadura coerulea]MBB6394736.1 3-carboxy-cis,cis-muconate cycloisomerase [Actinomadura coerulea]GGQ37097.1 3-carboxy-cis,cis-muconate cycloisomerase [Actinomadura coerulea]
MPSDEHGAPPAGHGPAGERPPAPDAGLLSPVRAGTEAEAATSDLAYLTAMLDAEAALARAQARLGLVPAAAAEAITAAAVADRFDLPALARRARGSGNPVVPLVADLRELAGAAGEHVHRGATSQDIADTGAMLVAARARRVVLAHLDRALDALAGLAARYRDTPMPARTLGRQALPTTFGAKAAGWLMGCLEAREGLAAVALPAQLGGPAGTLDAFGDRALDLVEAYAEETGLAPPVLPWHTRRAPVARLAAALAVAAGALGKIATDVWLLAQSEVGEVAEAAGAGRGGSSSMPHKRNPALSALVRSAALQVPAQVQVILAAQAAPHERPAGEWHAEWQPLRECLRLTGGAAETAAELLEGLEVSTELMRADLDDLLDVLGDDPGTGAAAALVGRALDAYRRSRT